MPLHAPTFLDERARQFIRRLTRCSASVLQKPVSRVFDTQRNLATAHAALPEQHSREARRLRCQRAVATLTID
jgi:hypothetical protein